MFEEYTERARRVLFFARYEASQFGSVTIETEHLLLGLLRERADFLRLFLVDRSVVDFRKEVESRIKVQDKVSISIDLPLSDECKRILAYAGEESDRLSHAYVGAHHLFLGILREKDCLAATILNSHGVDLDTACKVVADTPSDWPLVSEQVPIKNNLPRRFVATLRSIKKAVWSW